MKSAKPTNRGQQTALSRLFSRLSAAVLASAVLLAAMATGAATEGELVVPEETVEGSVLTKDKWDETTTTKPHKTTTTKPDKPHKTTTTTSGESTTTTSGGTTTTVIGSSTTTTVDAPTTTVPGDTTTTVVGSTTTSTFPDEVLVFTGPPDGRLALLAVAVVTSGILLLFGERRAALSGVGALAFLRRRCKQCRREAEFMTPHGRLCKPHTRAALENDDVLWMPSKLKRASRD